MRMYLIGSKSESNEVILSFADEHNIQLTASSNITSYDKFNSAVNNSLNYDVVVLDILDYGLEDEDFEEGIKLLTANYTGIIIVYAPSAAYSDNRIAICNRYGINNIIRDFLSSRAKTRLDSIVAPAIVNVIHKDNATTNEQDMTVLDCADDKPKAVASNTPNNDIDTQEPQSPQNQQVAKSVSSDFVQSLNRTYDMHSKPNLDIQSSEFTYHQTDNQNNMNIKETEQIYITKKIGVIGVLPRIGTTTQAVIITSFLSELGKSVCYIQYHQSSFLENMGNYFTGAEKDLQKDCIVYEGMDFYSNKNLVMSQNYEYHIYDYGSCTDSTQIPSDFYNNDIRIIVCGGTAEEVSRLTSLRNQLYIDNDLIYVFSFIADYEKDDIYDLMGEKAAHTLFAPYNPDCFKSSEESKNIYMPVFGFNTDNKNRKNSKLFRRRKGK